MASGSSVWSVVRNPRRVVRRGVGGALPTGEHDAGCQRVLFERAKTLWLFRTHGPGAGYGEAGADHGVQKRFPTRTGRSCIPAHFGLLERVVDRRRDSGMRLFGDPGDGPRHPQNEEAFRFDSPSVPVGASDQLGGLRDGERGEHVGESGPERAAQPNVEKV